MRLLSVLIAIGTLSACANDTNILSFVVGDAEYKVPAAHVQSFSRAPHQFVRIKPPGQPFDLVYDSRLSPQARNGWPMIFSVNDGSSPYVERRDSVGQKIVCRRAAAPASICGLALEDAGVKWSVLFAREHIPAAGKLFARASKQLQEYRADDHAVRESI
jgi:hypothetical protein